MNSSSGIGFFTIFIESRRRLLWIYAAAILTAIPASAYGLFHAKPQSLSRLFALSLASLSSGAGAIAALGSQQHDRILRAHELGTVQGTFQGSARSVAQLLSGENEQSMPVAMPADSLAAVVQNVFVQNKLQANYIGILKGSAFYRLLFMPNAKFTPSKFRLLSETIQIELHLEQEPIISTTNRGLAIDIPRGNREFPLFRDYFKPDPQKFEVPVGLDIEGKLITINFTDPSTPHVLVGGTTGSGKTNLMLGWIFAMIYGKTTDQIRLLVADGGQVSFTEIEGSPYLLEPIAHTPRDTIYILEKAVAIQKERATLFREASHKYNRKITGIWEYIEITGNRIPLIFVVLEEFQNLLEKASDLDEKRIEGLTSDLGQIARKAGIVICPGVQKAAKILDTAIRSNVPARVCCRVLTEADSEGIIGLKKTDGEKLLGKGDLLYRGEKGIVRLQSLLITEEDVRAMLSGKFGTTGLHGYADPSGYARLEGFVTEGNKYPEIYSPENSREVGEPGEVPPESPQPSQDSDRTDLASPTSQDSAAFDSEESGRSDFEKIKKLREIREGERWTPTSPTKIIQEIWGSGGNAFNKRTEQYWRLIDKFADEWIEELLRNFPDYENPKIIHIVWKVFNQQRTFRSDYPDKWQEYNNRIDEIRNWLASENGGEQP